MAILPHPGDFVGMRASRACKGNRGDGGFIPGPWKLNRLAPGREPCVPLCSGADEMTESIRPTVSASAAKTLLATAMETIAGIASLIEEVPA